MFKSSYNYNVRICDRSYAIGCVTLLVLISVNVIRDCDNEHRRNVRPQEASRGTCELVRFLLSITTVCVYVCMYACMYVHR